MSLDTAVRVIRSLGSRRNCKRSGSTISGVRMSGRCPPAGISSSRALGVAAMLSASDRDRGIGFAFLVADHGDIIESKQALGRESDLVALPELHRLHARLR